MTIRTITFDDEQWQVVPKNPVPAMIESGANEVIAPLPTAGAKAGAVYIAMLAAAPEPPAQRPEIRAVFRCGPSGKPGDGFIGEMDAPIWGPPEIEDDGSITVPIDHWPTPAQKPMTDREANNLADDHWNSLSIELIRAVEAFHGIGKGESNAD